jgi:ribose-phosphate pyrophosphokinase
MHHENVLAGFPFPAKTLSAISLLAEHFKQRGFEKAFTLAPDEGAMRIVEEAKTVLGGDYGYLEKQRDRYTGQIKVEKKMLNVKGKAVIIFDDIISTGGTIVAAAKILKDLGANEVYVACAHALLVRDAEKRILDAGVEEIIGTDSVPSHVSKVSLAPLLARELSH